ncbi:MAG: signal transduction histidine kinase [Mariniblastus sp.]|jgi:signal transduction histidine kinase
MLVLAEKNLPLSGLPKHPRRITRTASPISRGDVSNSVLKSVLKVILVVWLFAQLGLATAAVAADKKAPQASTKAAAGDFEPAANQRSIQQLERRLSAIDKQLAQLCTISLRGGIGSVGAGTAGRKHQTLEWFEIDLKQRFPIDHIVLTPMIWRDPVSQPQAEGFPIDFRVIAGVEGDSKGTVVASYSADDGLLPRIAPLVIPCHSRVASWVRIESSRLPPRHWDSRFSLQLSEVFVFSGGENVALHQNVKLSSDTKSPVESRQKRFLVDGGVPYLMNPRKGEKSIAFLKHFGVDARPVFSIDLGTPKPLDRVHFYTVEVNDTIPQTRMGGFGMPRRMLVEGANRADFSDSVQLFEFSADSIFDFGPIIMRRFPETTCRFVRFTVLEADVDVYDRNGGAVLGFAEIEIYSKNENVALEKPVNADFPDTSPNRSQRTLASITDGRNLYGDIPPMFSWLEELALRHDLENERPIVVAKLNDSYGRQSSRLTWVTRLSVLLAVGIGAAILIGTIVRKRQLASLKERFAADIHDELGANLHVIGMLADLAQAAASSPEKLQGLHREIRVMTERSGLALHHCTNLLDANELYQDLLEDMHRTTKRIMADMEGELSFDGDQEVLRCLKPRTRADLFLFYKECLVNISRHSEATQFSAKLIATPKSVRLIVNDNGQKQSSFSRNSIPPSLFRRAQLLDARVTAHRNEQGGTGITLNMKNGKWLRRKSANS